MPMRSVCRLHLDGDDARQPTAAVVRLDGLCSSAPRSASASLTPKSPRRPAARSTRWSPSACAASASPWPRPALRPGNASRRDQARSGPRLFRLTRHRRNRQPPRLKPQGQQENRNLGEKCELKLELTSARSSCRPLGGMSMSRETRWLSPDPCPLRHGDDPKIQGATSRAVGAVAVNHGHSP